MKPQRIVHTLLVACMAQAASAQTVDFNYSGNYSVTSLGSITAVPPNYGGMIFKDANTLWVSGQGTKVGGRYYSVPVTRGAGNHIVSLGSGKILGFGTFSDGGIAFGPGGVLFYTEFPGNSIGEVLPPGYTSDYKTVSLTPLGVGASMGASVGALNFVPPGYHGAGQLKVDSISTNEFDTIPLTPDGTGGYNLGSATRETTLNTCASSCGAEAFLYVPLGSPLFPSQSMLVAEFFSGTVGSYLIDANGNPMPASRRDFITGLDGAQSGAIDPVTGDIILASFGHGNQVIEVRGFAAPPQPYYFSDLVFGGGFQTTLTYINYSPQAVTCVTNFYSDSGGPLSIPFSQGPVSTRTDTLQPGQSIHDQTVAHLTAAVMQGWAQASCTGAVEASLLYRYYINGVAASEAGVNAETAPTFSFVTFAQTATGVAYANPSPTQSAAVTFTVFSNTGAPLASKGIVLGPLAHDAKNLGPLLGLQTFTGMLEITSTIPIISLSLNAEAFPVISSLPPGDLPAGFGGGGGTTQYYFSDLAFGGGFQTTLTLINYSPQTVTCTTNFYSDTGGPLSVPFGQGTISTRVDVLPAGGSIHDQTVAGLTAMGAEGWAQSSCTGAIEASLLYRYYTNGVAASEAGVNAETAPTTEFATFAETATGVAYANPSTTQSATITFTVYDAAGTKLASHVVTLAPLTHEAKNLGPLLGLQSFTGFVKITSTIPIISLSLNAEAFPVISSLPPGDLPGSTGLVTP